jgi:hypothetical protein
LPPELVSTFADAKGQPWEAWEVSFPDKEINGPSIPQFSRFSLGKGLFEGLVLEVVVPWEGKMDERFSDKLSWRQCR